MNKTRRQVLGLVLAAFAVYGLAFIHRTSFEVEGERFFSLFDDMMISMRYAKNLAEGQGLVWNPGGERVEGYTNPLWVLYMAIFHLLPIPASKVSLSIQLSSLLFLLINLVYVDRIAEHLSPGGGFVPRASVLLTAFYLPLNNWGLQGTEVGLLTLLVSMSVWKALEAMRRDVFSPWPYLLLGAATLVRLDAVVPFLAILLVLAVAQPGRRRQHLRFALSTLAILLVGQTLLRLAYYGELLPNTYYLKLTGYPLALRLGRGLFVLAEFLLDLNWVLAVGAGAALWLRRDRYVSLLFCVFAAQVLYSVYVGGDAWEWWGGANRYLSVAMPLFFILLSVTFGELRALALGGSGAAGKRWVRYGFAALLILSLVSVNTPRGFKSLRAWLLVDPPLHVLGNRQKVELALLLRRLTTEQASVAVVWAGAIPYFSERPSVDMLGKSDRRIARGKARVPEGSSERLVGFLPGHMKFDYAYSIGERKPDVVTRLWWEEEEGKVYLDRDYTQAAGVYLRNGSTRVLWERVGHSTPR